MEILDQRGPLNPCLDMQQAALAIKLENTIHAAGVDQYCSVGELLAAHRVPASGNANAFARLAQLSDQILTFVRRSRGQNLSHQCGIELRVDVVYQQLVRWNHGRRAVHRLRTTMIYALTATGAERERGTGHQTGLDKFASRICCWLFSRDRIFHDAEGSKGSFSIQATLHACASMARNGVGSIRTAEK